MKQFEPFGGIFGLLAENPVMLPPGCARFVTMPEPSASAAIANTIGMEVVAPFTSATAPPYVTITSTFCCTDSLAISATRSGLPCDQRYSIVIVRP